MSAEAVRQVAELVRERNAIDDKITAIIKRPVASGHLWEWLAAQLFGIELELSAAKRGFDGRFVSGPLAGRTVDVKWSSQAKGLLNMKEAEELDYYLVFAGPASPPGTSREISLPWCIESVYLFDAKRLFVAQRARGVRVGTQSKVPPVQWEAAELYPRPRNPLLKIRPEQRELLGLFALHLTLLFMSHAVYGLACPTLQL